MYICPHVLLNVIFPLNQRIFVGFFLSSYSLAQHKDNGRPTFQLTFSFGWRAFCYVFLCISLHLYLNKIRRASFFSLILWNKFLWFFFYELVVVVFFLLRIFLFQFGFSFIHFGFVCVFFLALILFIINATSEAWRSMKSHQVNHVLWAIFTRNPCIRRPIELKLVSFLWGTNEQAQNKTK